MKCGVVIPSMMGHYAKRSVASHAETNVIERVFRAVVIHLMSIQLWSVRSACQLRPASWSSSPAHRGSILVEATEMSGGLGHPIIKVYMIGLQGQFKKLMAILFSNNNKFIINGRYNRS